ncbi:peptide chain release factor N(5)-glutamine methyltransferase [Peptostreptococcus stomatis]|uniref:peptide chain release factor N(5)-glutamine methyltransferase n=1 Tax=Peptostreptococcus stomatis TaxID=341694 RepID=UPI003F9FE028
MNLAVLIKDIIEKYSGLLSPTSPTARLDVEVILCHILGWDRVKLMINYGQDLDLDKMSIFEDMIAKRLDQMPIAYIINKKEFMGLDFYVDERVLIPRPDTELLVEDLVESIGEMESTKQARDINVLDMCTGSGAIILSGASLWKDRAKEDSGKAKDGTVNFIGVDISKSALEVATINRKSFGLDTVKLIESDLFTNLGDYRGCLDIIVSNPPYIEDQVIEGLERDVKDYEPRLALAGGNDGMDFYNRIIEDAYDYLKLGGKLVFESGHDQAEKILKKMAQVGYTKAYTKKDIQGFDRLVAAYKY